MGCMCTGQVAWFFTNTSNDNTLPLLPLPVNDSTNLVGSGGSHWSLLIFETASSCFFYFDSASQVSFLPLQAHWFVLDYSDVCFSPFHVHTVTLLFWCTHGPPLSLFSCFFCPPPARKQACNHSCNMLTPITEQPPQCSKAGPETGSILDRTTFWSSEGCCTSRERAV